MMFAGPVIFSRNQTGGVNTGDEGVTRGDLRISVGAGDDGATIRGGTVRICVKGPGYRILVPVPDNVTTIKIVPRGGHTD